MWSIRSLFVYKLTQHTWSVPELEYLAEAELLAGMQALHAAWVSPYTFKNACRAMGYILCSRNCSSCSGGELASFGMVLGCGSLCCNLLQAVRFNAAHTLEQCSHILTDLHNRLHGQGLAATFRFLEGTLFHSMWEGTFLEEALQLDRLRLSRVHASHILGHTAQVLF